MGRKNRRHVMKKINKKLLIGIIIIILIIAVIILGYKLYKKNEETILVSENMYNKTIYEMAEYMEDVKNYLAKSTITSSATHGAETLTALWREANLAQTYLAMLPIESQELENTEKFLNQVSDYSFTLSRKNIKGENLSDEELENLDELYNYSVDLCNAVNQIITELENGEIKWSDLTNDNKVDYAQEVSINFDMASSMEDNFDEYTGLIYDGAFSEHITSKEKKGLTGDNITEEEGEEIAKKFIDKSEIKELKKLGYSENAEVPVYSYSITTDKDEEVTFTLSEKGGHLVYMNVNRDVSDEKISEEQACEYGQEYLEEHGYSNMKETYYLKNEGIVTINYAYTQDGVIIYTDLIKLKIALDTGEVIGLEATGYLNNHTTRDLSDKKITKEQAKSILNKKLNIESEGMAIIPTESNEEVLCYEFKGKIDDLEYLVYINAKTGEEQDVMIITNTPNGRLAM